MPKFEKINNFIKNIIDICIWEITLYSNSIKFYY